MHFLQVRSSKNVFVESETKLDISVISNLRRVTSLRTVGEKRDPKIRGHVGTEDPITKRQRRKIWMVGETDVGSYLVLDKVTKI